MAAIIFILTLFIVHITCSECQREEDVVIKKVCQGEHFEGPHWSTTDNALYWIDISEQKVYRLEIETMSVTNITIGYGPVSLVVSIKDNPNLALVAVRSELYIMNWTSFKDDRSLRLLSIVDLGLPDNRINDGKVDSKGRLWFGTMGKEAGDDLDKDQGTLYMIDQHNYLNPKAMVRPVSISNGVVWTADNKHMFYIDTPTKNIDVFEFDVENGLIRNRTIFFSFEDNDVVGSPDGLTIDSDDNLWVACHNGGQVIKIDGRTGQILEQYKLPAAKVTSVMFGGPDLSTLFVTTSCRDLSQDERSNQPGAGWLFTIEGTGSKGQPQYSFVFPNASSY